MARFCLGAVKWSGASIGMPAVCRNARANLIKWPPRRSFVIGLSPHHTIFPSKSVTFPELNLADHFLIAMPTTVDPLFGGSVIYICEHNEEGALGVIVNKTTDLTADTLFERLDLKLEISAGSGTPGARPIMFGGPVQIERGFILHTLPGEFSSMIRVSDEVALTTSKDVLEAVTQGHSPEKMLIALGCSGWSAGQLEAEIARNGWLTVKADPGIIFDMPVSERFGAAIKLLGFDLSMLTGEAGHA
jgi:putative transcriptional regulator